MPPDDAAPAASARLIDLSADVGESFGSWTMGDDAAVLEVVTSANVACGFHGGDPRVMERTVATCLQRGVGIGAHPGFADLVGFGRRSLETSADELRTDVLYQLGALSAFTRAAGARLVHLSPHGRLGNLVVTDEAYARPVVEAVLAFDPTLVVATQEGVLARLARDEGLRVARLAFPDRDHHADGTLVSRREPGAVLHDPDEIAARALAVATTGLLPAREGGEVEVVADSLVLHGDNAASVAAARQVREALTGGGVAVVPLLQVLGALDRD